MDNERSLLTHAARPRARPPRPETCRMFENALLERLSRVHPATPFVFWLPVLGWLAVRSGRSEISLAGAGGLALGGLLLWTLVEYLLHRFVFHYTGARPWQRRLHFIIHGVHHEHPQDADRLVMPLGVSVPLGVAFYALLRAAIGEARADPTFIGLVLGYLAYDGTHYMIHHHPMRSRLGKWLKRHHMIHHHADPSSRWGVSTPLWDWLCGSLRRAPARVRGAAAGSGPP